MQWLIFICTRQVGAAIHATLHLSDATIRQSKSSNLGKETERDLK